MGRHQLRVLRFALRYSAGWHTWGTDTATQQAVMTLGDLGLLELNHETRQFRAKLGDRA